MPITPPVIDTEISASAFGVPVANAVNELKTGPYVAGKIAAVNQSIPSPAVTDVTGMSVTFTAKANRIYRVDWMVSMTSVGNSNWLLHQFVGGTVPNQEAYVSFTGGTGAFAAYGHSIPGSYFVGPGLRYTFAPGSTTLKLQVTCGAGAFGVSGTCLLVVTEMGGVF